MWWIWQFLIFLMSCQDQLFYGKIACWFPNHMCFCHFRLPCCNRARTYFFSCFCFIVCVGILRRIFHTSFTRIPVMWNYVHTQPNLMAKNTFSMKCAIFRYFSVWIIRATFVRMRNTWVAHISYISGIFIVKYTCNGRIHFVQQPKKLIYFYEFYKDRKNYEN